MGSPYPFNIGTCTARVCGHLSSPQYIQALWPLENQVKISETRYTELITNNKASQACMGFLM